MSTLNRSIPFVLLALFGLFGASAANAETKIGVVNFQKLLEDAPQTKTALSALDNEFAPRRRELLTMQNDLKARDEKLQREGAVMAEADRVKAEKSLRDEQREFSRKAGEYQDDASQRRNEELGKVQRYLVEEVRSYANTQGFDLVIAGDTLLFAKGQLDITANVLAVVLTKPATLPAAPAPAPAPAAQPKPAGNK
jgi:outer membrane protein